MNKKFKILPMFEQQQLAIFDPLYSNLEVDPYVEEGYRFKNIMRVRTDTIKVVKGSHEPLFQSGKYNPVHGDIVRAYPEIPAAFHNQVLFDAIKSYAKLCGISYDQEILVQAQRIKCSKTLEGLPAVEGHHRDGKTFIAIFCVGRHNVNGGETQISYDKGDNIVHRQTLAPGEILIMDDTEYFHYATPIECIDDQQDGFRDIFLFSTPSSRASEVLY